MSNIYFLLNTLLLLFFTLNKQSLVLTREALAELWNVNDAEILNLLAIEEQLIIVDRTLQLLLESYESSFGGTYIDVKKEKVLINTVDSSKVPIILNSPEIKLNNYSRFLDFVPAEKSFTKLKYNFIKISDLIKKYRPFQIQCYIDMKLNNIVIGYTNKYSDPNRKFIKSAEKYKPIFIRLRNQDPEDEKPKAFQAQIASRDIDIIPKIFNGDGITTFENDCSMGFPARNNDLIYIVTAAHCYKENKLFYHIPWNSNKVYAQLGQMIKSEHMAEYDFGLIKLDENATKLISTRIRNTDSEHAELNVEGGRIITSHGAHACKSGLTTHVTCGYVVGLNAIVTYIDSKIVENLVLYGKENSTISKGGDSGGSVFSYLQTLSNVSLNGIHIGRSIDLSTYLPLDLILSKGEIELVKTPL
ncbi:hypothetical protein C2G38_2036109 [Gigaspora rosea]|uniref:Peptidase S1 domain-containing protein n=1 Tax=Gigaspora rosea TaxID=44941 RepID=A0A397VHI7_9GLOM|nr:hypothetical protein C2G38_2036109 [Gigaspora rosea]